MASRTEMQLPLDFASWLGENAGTLKPPVSNRSLYSGKDFVLMIVGGPNTRNDFHVNQTEEWFYQIKGSMKLRLVEDNKIRDIELKEGEMFLVPGNTPHSPIRYKDTLGFVMERTRPPGSQDRLQWYCSKGNHEHPVMIREDVFFCEDLETQLDPLIQRWMANEELRVCPECGIVEDPM